MADATIDSILEWMKNNPEFQIKPASIREFLGPEYLNIAGKVRPRIADILGEIFGDEVSGVSIASYQRALVTGGIGIGKTTFASIVLPYMCHWVLCLKDPQDYFNLLPGSRIAFMMMSTSETQAKEVIFADVVARIQNSPWFNAYHQKDPAFKNQIRFPGKDIWILPGDSVDTTFEGYNILGGVLDEGDSHKVTKQKGDYAELGYNAINARIESRFQDRGFLIVIGQMKKSNGFMAKKYAEFKKDKTSYAARMTIWESLGWHNYLNPDGSRNSFFYDPRRKKLIEKSFVALVSPEEVIEIPEVYRHSFENKPEIALRDLAGIPPAIGDPFISLVDKIEMARDKYVERVGADSPVDDNCLIPKIAKWFVAGETLKRAVHVDIAYSGDGDAMGIAMGHVSEVVEIDDEKKPYIIIDCLIRLCAPAGGEIMLSDMRRIIYDLKDERKFNIKKVTFDGFQCFTGDTLVPLLDGRTLSMRALATEYPDGSFWVYSIDNESKKIVPGRVSKAWKTATKEILEVHLDNGEVVRCTPDHRFMLRDGSYRQAKDLTSGISLMPLYRRVVSSDMGFMGEYEQVAQPGPRNTNERHVRDVSEYAPSRWQYTHRMVAGEVPTGYVRHHEDHNKLNNSPDNLSIISSSEHSSSHHTREHWTEERTRSVSEAISKSNSDRVSIEARAWNHNVTIEDLKKYAHLTRQEVTRQTGWSQDLIYNRLRLAGYSGWREFRAAAVNHKVVKIVFTGEIEDVYDLTVDEYHNFALEAGVFVHNSQDTIQQMRKRRYETDYLSVDRSILPYHDLREAIYEHRIEFPKYVTTLRPGSADKVEIALDELMGLTEAGNKVDHGPDGSKDVADAMAGVCYTLMGDRQYRRGVVSIGTARKHRAESTGTDGSPVLPSGLVGLSSIKAPVPPGLLTTSMFPSGLRRRER